MLNVGDAVLTFLGDTSQLDQVFARVPAQAAESMGAAAASVGQVGTAFEAVNFELDATASNVPYCGEVIKETMNEAGTSTRMAAGEVTLLGELFGIHLPRHVRTFIGELPGVGTALQAAFAATAVLFIVDALIKGIEKITEWAHSAEQVQQAMDDWDKAQQKVFNGLEEGVARAQIRLDDLSGNHLEALRLKLQLIDNQTLAKLDSELEKLGQEADKVFQKLDRNWFSQAFLGLEGSEDAQKKLKDIQKAISEAFATKTPEAYGEAMKVLQAAFDETTKKLQVFDDQVKKHEQAVEAVKNSIGPAGDIVPAPDSKQITAWEQLGKTIRGYISDIQEAKKEADLQKKDTSLQEMSKEATEQAAAAKRSFDDQIASIEKWKAGVHLAYASGKVDVADWKVAEVQAADASAIAHEQYLQRVIVIYTKAGETQKAQAAQQQLATLKVKDATKETETLAVAEEKHREAAAKITAEYTKMVNVGIEKEFAASTKATEGLAKAQEALLKTQTALAVENTAKQYHDQEEAIKQLASMQLITEEQKNQKLIQLYNQQEAAALKTLQDQLAKEKAIIDATQVKVKSAEGNPFFTDAQVLELKKNLAVAETAYLKTQDQISKTEDKFEKERLALQKGAVGQAIALATAAGNQKLALDLKQHQSALIAIQDQIALAKSRGQDVSAMKEQEKEIDNATKALVAQATQISKVKQAWDIFSADFAKRAKTDETTAQQMAQSFTTAAQGLETGIQSAFAAMVSGTESAGQAIEKAAFSTIAKIAEQWGAYYLARAIADAFDNPAAAAGEFAAGAALEALGGVLGALGSASSAKSTSSTAAASTAATPAAGAPATANPTGGAPVNIPRLFSGAIVTQPTVAMIGDRQGGGSQTEGVFPLDDPRAAQAIAKLFGGAAGGGTIHNWNVQGMISTTDLVKLSRTITRGTQTGRLRVSVSNSGRVTRKV